MEFKQELENARAAGEMPPAAVPNSLPAETTRRKFWRPSRLAKLAAIPLAVMGLGAYRYFSEDPGYLISYDPRVDAPALEDNMLKVASWNVAGRAAADYRQIEALALQENDDAVALQEVTADDAHRLHRLLSEWHQRFWVADSMQHGVTDLEHGDQGGYGDLLLTRSVPHDFAHKMLPGTPWGQALVGTVTGASQDLASIDLQFPDAKAGRQENRDAMAETINVDYNGEPIPVRVMTSHIAGLDPIHDVQQEGLLNFIDDNQSNTIPLVFIGDLNEDNDEAIDAFTNHRMYVVPSGSRTSLTNDIAIDHGAYSPAGHLGRYSLKVIHKINGRKITKKISDHYPIELNLELKP